eukprot:TRINITY_DN7626_c0_g1_i8.p1 TRINITY_DN7626_c0_g1~~TRINITY_DN7626_c0_g1_i8.p1  ORF type:complete len:252 (-),score=29.87 TRINITY_DN7626_c0_g1_i8:324-1079(-)
MSTSFLGLNGTPAEVVGGHPDHFFLGPENGQLSKLVKAQAPEITCYEYLERKGLTRFFPRYFGQRPCGKEGFVFIIMEDLTYSYEHPLPLDTKIGYITHAPDSAELKAIRQERIDVRSTSRSTGVRLTGYKYFDTNINCTVLVGKDVTLTIAPPELINHYRRYFTTDSLRVDVVTFVLKELRALRNWFKTGEVGLQLFSASVLIVWDALKPEPSATVRIIDLAHPFPLQSNWDDNFLGGLEYLIDLFETLR